MTSHRKQSLRRLNLALTVVAGAWTALTVLLVRGL